MVLVTTGDSTSVKLIGRPDDSVIAHVANSPSMSVKSLTSCNTPVPVVPMASAIPSPHVPP